MTATDVADVKYYQTCAKIELKQYQNAIALVKEDGLRIADVDSKLLTEELCIFAVQQNPDAFVLIPDHIKYQVSFLKVVLLHEGKLLKLVESSRFSKQTYKQLCFNAIGNNPDNIQYVEDEMLYLHFESLLDFSIVDI